MTADPRAYVAGLDELARLHEAATPGPWRHDERIAGPGVIHGSNGTPSGIYLRRQDAAAIVAAHNALPALIAAVRAGLALADAVERGEGHEAFIGRPWPEVIREVLSGPLGHDEEEGP